MLEKIRAVCAALDDLCMDDELCAETEDLLFYIDSLDDDETDELKDALCDMTALADRFAREDGCKAEAQKLRLLAQTAITEL